MKSNIYEPVDNTPVEIPTRLRLPQSRTEQIRQFIREEMSRASAESGHETFEEADDLEPDEEEVMPYSAYELADLEPPLEPPAPFAKPVEAEGQPPAIPAASSKGIAAPNPSPEGSHGA